MYVELGPGETLTVGGDVYRRPHKARGTEKVYVRAHTDKKVRRFDDQGKEIPIISDPGASG